MIVKLEKERVARKIQKESLPHSFCYPGLGCILKLRQFHDLLFV